MSSPAPASNLSATTVLASARRTANRHGSGLILVPAAARMPSALQRNWLATTAGSLAAAYCLYFLYRHSALAGSDDLARWGRAAVRAVADSWEEHVVGPLRAVGDELFSTFRARPSIVSPEEFQQDRDSLARMLSAFRMQEAPAPSSDGTVAAVTASAAGEVGGALSATEAEVVAGLVAVMRRYEADLQHPLRNLVAGQLARCLLIQVQKLKVDVEAAMLQLDQILRANELNLSLMAALPSLGGAALAAGWLYRTLGPRRVALKAQALPCRMSLLRLIQTMEAGRTAGEGRGEGEEEQGAHRRRGWRAEAERMGINFYRLNQVYAEAWQLFQYHRLVQNQKPGASEWPNLVVDLYTLASALQHSPAACLRQTRRIAASYSIFQP